MWRRKMERCPSSCRQLIAAQFPTWTALIFQINALPQLPVKGKQILFLQSGLPFQCFLEKQGKKRSWTLWRFFWRDYRWLGVKAICTTCQSRHQQNIKSLEPNFTITWENQNEKTLSQSHFDEGFLFPLNCKIIFIFCYFCKQIIWQLWISHTKSVQHVFIIRAWIDWKSTFAKIQCSLQYNGFCHFCHSYN